MIDVDCSKGTYVRTLAADIGALLGFGAHLVALRRTCIGTLDLASAVTLAYLETIGAGGKGCVAGARQIRCCAMFRRPG